MTPPTETFDLYHYFDKSTGPFQNLSMLSRQEAELVQSTVSRTAGFFAGQRPDDYVRTRFELEETARACFVGKGGTPSLSRPYTMSLGSCPWIRTWFPKPDCVLLNLPEVEPGEISFTYGDLFPAFLLEENNPHRGTVYTVEEIGDVVSRFGLPQVNNPDGRYGPVRYIEAQIWSRKPIELCLEKYLEGNGL